MLDSLVRVSRRVVKLSKAEAPLTGAIIPPESIPSQQRRGSGAGPGRSVIREEPRALAGSPGAQKANRLLEMYRRATSRDTGALPNRREPRPAEGQAAHPGRRPAPSGSRRPTRGEVRPTAHWNGPTPRRVERQPDTTPPRIAPRGRPAPSAEGGGQWPDGRESHPFDLSDFSRLPQNGFTYF